MSCPHAYADTRYYQDDGETIVYRKSSRALIANNTNRWVRLITVDNMIPRSCVAIETKKFPILEGEDDEIVNEKMYGKALCKYLEHNLPKVGIKVPSFNAEDWGWWLEVEDNNFRMALCIYSDPDAKHDPERYAILPSIHNEKKWSWPKCRSIDVSKNVLKIMDGLEKLFREDSEIKTVTRHDDFPF